MSRIMLATAPTPHPRRSDPHTKSRNRIEIGPV
jgi:hypothetical protein